NGTNLLAIELHQAALTSSDLALDFELTAAGFLPANAPVQVAATGRTIGLSWPSAGSYLSLYAATNLTRPILWNRVTNPPAFVSTQWNLTLPAPTNGQRFFRLQSP